MTLLLFTNNWSDTLSPSYRSALSALKSKQKNVNEAKLVSISQKHARHACYYGTYALVTRNLQNKFLT